MDSFEENLAIFESTSQGSEMKESLRKCFHILVNNVMSVIRDVGYLKNRVEELERR